MALAMESRYHAGKSGENNNGDINGKIQSFGNGNGNGSSNVYDCNNSNGKGSNKGDERGTFSEESRTELPLLAKMCNILFIGFLFMEISTTASNFSEW